ncbi:MAG TPA: efflux transporter outer membrane subunit [Syntrophobacteraceae bacterium]|nr:efflux transporter outer membrane subunit [Syntrophobacteraceae bacterium]
MKSSCFPNKMDRFWVLHLAVVLLLASCAVGPDFHSPKTPLPAAWSSLSAGAPDQTSVTTPQPADLVAWWKVFNDPLLTSLVERAFASNLDLRQAKARIRQARATRGIAASGLWPEIDANASYDRSLNSSASFGSSGTSLQSTALRSARELFQVGLDASWELDLFGGVRRNIEAAQADYQAAVEDWHGVRVSLAAEVGINYVALRGFQQQILIARQNLAMQRHTAEITGKRFAAGFASGLDAANANALVATTESQVPLLESSAQAAIFGLSVLLGLEPAALAQELASDKAIPTTPPEVPVGLPSDLIRRRPDIRSAEARLHASTARIGAATADLFPKFSLTGSAGYLSSDISSLANFSSRYWSYGVGMYWPIFTAGRIRWNIELQKAFREEDLAAYEQTILTALKDVETALVAYAKDQQRISSLAVAVENNRKAVDLSTRLYVVGKSDFLNVLVAERALNTSEDALVQSTRSMATNLIALYKALGGGWEMETPVN